MEFNVTWPNGQTEMDSSESATADAYAMERWGCNTAADVFTAYGVRIQSTEHADTFEPTQPALTEEQLAALQAAEQPPAEGTLAPVI